MRYGSKTIEYTFLEKEGLKSHYISVEKHSGVTLKGKLVSPEMADRLILKKAKWILNKLKLVGAAKPEDIVTGSRLSYLGRSYYVQVVVDKQISDVKIEFNHSKFKISIPDRTTSQSDIKKALEQFYRERAIEKITPRVQKWAERTQLSYKGLKFLKMGKRWGSCTGSNTIILNYDAVKLSFSLIDYIIVHELCHTKVKDHSKRFWAELSKHHPKWKELDESIKLLQL